MVMLIIPSLVGVTGYGILQYYLMIYERDTGKNLIDTYWILWSFKLFTLSDFYSCYSCCDCNVSKLERDAGGTAGQALVLNRESVT